jgi:SAM-dependent methyltransferase
MTEHRIRENMAGLAHRPHHYQHTAGRVFGAIHRRIVADAAGLPLPAGARVLDVGCGPGTLTVALAEARAYRVDGLDLSPEMIAHATRNGEASPAAVRLNFTVGDVRELPFPDDSFELIVSSMSQHHWADPAAGVREIRRVLKPGGRAWIYDARFAFRRLGDERIVKRPVRTGRLPIRLIARAEVEPQRVAAVRRSRSSSGLGRQA